MWTTTLRALGLAFAMLLALAHPACRDRSANPPPGKPVVLCTVFAYFDAARAIGKDFIDAQILVPPATSPHEFDPPAGSARLAAKTRLYIKNGMGLDDRFDKLLAGGPARILTISQAIPQNLILSTAEVSLDEPTGTAPTASAAAPTLNPHIWLDPLVQIQAAQVIRDALSALDPAHKDAFEQNSATYIAQLNQLHADFLAASQQFKTRDFIGFHSAYDYLAHRYNLHQVAAIEEIPGAGLSVAQAEKIVRLIQQHHIRYIAVESALSGASAAIIENRTGVRSITLQPLETYDDLHDTYVSLMRRNLDALRTALGG